MKLTNLIAAGLTATLLASGASYAQTAPAQAQVTVMNQAVAQMPEVQALIEELKAQGYTNIEIRRTLLGRARIIAQGPNGSREVVMSTSSGEVMRDMMRGHNGMDGNMDGGNMDGGNMDGGNMDRGNMDGGNMDGGNMDGGNMGGSAGNMGGSAGNMGGNMGGGMGGN